MDIRVTPLGAGQDVGRSCLLLSIGLSLFFTSDIVPIYSGGKNVMLDCGMHMGYSDDRRFPDFSYITTDEPLTEHLDCIIISHFHLDHCGALPYMTEMVGYNGPIYMTVPTKAIAPILLEDMRKVAVDKKGEQNFFTSAMIKDCMKKVVSVNLHQVVQVDSELEIKAYYAGHVLGAAMFQVRVGGQSIVYTGDYNMTPDRHLGAAWIDKCRPDLLITESTYATTVRDSKRCRERDFLKKVHDCIDKGGKVLIPVFALGRAQELCILLETYWERMNLKCPIYFSAGMTEKANNYYKMFISWTNEKIRKTFVDRNMFDFKHIKAYDRSYVDNPGPMVVFATPGMLHAGLSLTIFRRWCGEERNMIIMPGYCVAGTIGHKILNGQKRIEFEKGQVTEVKMSVQYMSFSAHADAKGIMQLISWCEPRNVMLVHGEGEKMKFLKSKIKAEHGIDCFMPANGETAVIPGRASVPARVSVSLLKKEAALYALQPPDSKRPRLLHGVMVMRSDGSFTLEEPDAAAAQLGVTPHTVRFTTKVSLDDPGEVDAVLGRVQAAAQERLQGSNFLLNRNNEGELKVESVIVQVEPSGEDGVKDVRVSWAFTDDFLGSTILQAIQGIQ